jgi:hypothetical protein
VTICAAVLAANSKAIVCIADKALTFDSGQEGGPPLQSIQWDSDSTKIVPLNQKGILCMFAGGEDGVSRVLSKLLARDTLGATVEEIKKTVEDDFKESIEEIVQIRILNPNLLTKGQYILAMSGQSVNPFIRSLAERVDNFDLNCEMLICGFAASGEPFILYAVSKGLVDDMARTGFQAIGSGWPYVHARLLWSRHERAHSVGRVLFDIFNAKASAEMDPHVGFDWDAHVIILHKDGPSHVTISKKWKKMVEAGWRLYDRSPFEKRNPREDLPDPKPTWKQQLIEYGDSLTQSVSRKSKQAR